MGSATSYVLDKAGVMTPAVASIHIRMQGIDVYLTVRDADDLAVVNALMEKVRSAVDDASKQPSGGEKHEA